mmetsp:Transcript_64270/g.150942  ORF Transcript_64270/g.150942 Transcript_64270/m.150942 type:complete len:351 (+) Transcript_64270:75-1127(+)
MELPHPEMALEPVDGRGRQQELVEVVIKDPLSLKRNEFVCSRLCGPPKGIRFHLEVMPKRKQGTEDDLESLSARIAVKAPLVNSWQGQELFGEATVTVLNPSRCSDDTKLSAKFSALPMCRRWYFFPSGTVSDWLDEEGRLRVQAGVSYTLPKDRMIPALRSFDFGEELTPVTIRFASDPPFFVDKRLLQARSKYFRDMLGKDWKEAQTHEVDLSSNPVASRETFRPILMYFMTDTVPTLRDAKLACDVRGLADQLGLTKLVALVEKEISSVLMTSATVLTVLGHVLGSASALEEACMKMVRANQCELLEMHREQLGHIARDNAPLAGELMRFLVESTSEQRARKRPRKV